MASNVVIVERSAKALNTINAEAKRLGDMLNINSMEGIAGRPAPEYRRVLELESLADYLRRAANALDRRLSEFPGDPETLTEAVSALDGGDGDDDAGGDETPVVGQPDAPQGTFVAGDDSLMPEYTELRGMDTPRPNVPEPGTGAVTGDEIATVAPEPIAGSEPKRGPGRPRKQGK